MPFRRVIQRNSEPPAFLEANTFPETTSCNGQYKFITRDFSTKKAFFVFQYFEKVDKKHNPDLIAAGNADKNDFVSIKSLCKMIVPRQPILKVHDIFPLSHSGTITVAFVFTSAGHNADAEQETKNIWKVDYNMVPELFRTRMFTARLKEILPDEFLVYEQTQLEHYCEFNAKIDLGIMKNHTVAVSIVEEEMETDSPATPIPKTFVDEVKDEGIGFKHYQALAGMLAFASHNAVNEYISQRIEVDIIKSYGVSGSGAKACVLEMTLHMSNGHIDISRSEIMDLLPAFNYVLEQIS